MDLEDTKRKLNFEDITVRCRSVAKLTKQISAKATKTKPLSASSAQIAELELLFEACDSSCFTTCTTACDGITYLVSLGFLEFDYAVTRFLSILSLSRNACAVVNALTKLIVIQLNAKDGAKESHYSLQYPKHPLIAVLEKKPNTLPLILRSLNYAIDKLPNSDAFTVMEPVINYIFLNPYEVPEHAMPRSWLLKQVVNCFPNHSCQIIKYVFQILPWLQIHSFQEVGDVCCFLSCLEKVILQLPKDNEGLMMLEKLLFFSLVTTNSCLQHHFDPSEALEVAENLSSHLNMEGQQSLYVTASMILLSMLLKDNSGCVAVKLLNIGRYLFRDTGYSRIAAAMMMVPVVLFVNEPKVLSFHAEPSMKALSVSFLKKLESCINESPVASCSVPQDVDDLSLFQHFSSVASDSILCARFAVILEFSDIKTKISWLKDVRNFVREGAEVSDFIFHLIIALLFLPNEDHELYVLCLEVLEIISTKVSTISVKMTSLILYMLTQETDSKRRLLLLECLSKSACHKYAVSPVLSVLETMATHQELKAQAIYLMFLLVKNQNRCFSYLQKLLTTVDKNVYPQSGVYEVVIAQAAVIKELCFENPEKYCGDAIGVIEATLNLPSTEASTPAVILALDGIIHLCKTENVELRSAWKSLSPKLCRDKRGPVIVRLCHLLSLVPTFQTKSFEYEKFMKEGAAFLWKLISSSTLPSVVSAAYKALSDYPIDCYSLKQLPPGAKANLKLPPSMTATPFEMGKLPEDVLTYIPGYCFIDLLKSMDDSTILEGYDSFLQSLVREEVKELPRGVYAQRKLVSKKRNPDDQLSKIPGALCLQFEKKMLAIQKNLAVGILLSYEAPTELNKDKKRALLLQSNLYLQVLSMLLSEVNLDCIDWQRCLLVPPAWGSFMEQVFFACEESRRELLHMDKGQSTKAMHEVAVATAWLQVRDDILEKIRGAVMSKDSTANTVTNSIFAVAALVKAINKFYTGLDTESKDISKECVKHMNHKTFQIMCAETILSAFDPQHRASSKILGWLTQLQKRSSSAEAMVKGCAAASLYHLLPLIKTEFNDKIPYIFVAFSGHLLAVNPAPMTLYSGIGIGLFIRDMCLEATVSGSNDQIDIILKAVENLEAGCNGEDFVRGKLIGLTLAVSGMCQNGNPVFIPHVQSICDFIQSLLDQEDPNSMQYEFVSICSSCIIVSATSANILPVLTIKNAISWFQNQRASMPQCPSTAVSLGILVDSLMKLGDPGSTDVFENLAKMWLETLATEKEPTLRRLAALNGLCALFSSGRGLIQINKDLATDCSPLLLKNLIQLMLQLLHATRDQSLQSICCWELGRMFSVHSGQQDTSSALPTNYSYLSERSILKRLTDFIQETQSSGRMRGNIHFISALKTLSQNFSRPLPPLNWVAFLSPMLQNSEDSEVMERSLEIVVHQMATSSSALAVVSSFTTPSQYHILPRNCQMFLLKNIPAISSSLPPMKLRAFLQAAVLEPTARKVTADDCDIHVIQGIAESLKKKSLNPGIVSALQDVLKDVLLHALKSRKCQLPLICDLILVWPDECQVSFLHELENEDYLSVLVLIQCYFIKKGKYSLTSLRPTIEIAKNADTSIKQVVLSVLLDCFITGANQAESDVSKPDKCISFVMETIGWMNVLNDKSSRYQLSNTNEVALFLFDVCMAVIIGSAGYRVSYTIWPENIMDHKMLIRHFPAAFTLLIRNDHWNDSLEKVIDWLLKLKWCSFLSKDDEYYIQAAFCVLRATKAFKKASVWTEVVPRAVIQF